MNIEGILLLPDVAEKLARKHGINPDEVAEVFQSAPLYRFVEKGDREGEDLYAALGRTEAGRYAVMFFIYKLTREALIITGREMTAGERRWYGRHRA